MARMTAKLAALVGVFVFTSATAFAASYKCADAAGKIRYSDRPCSERGMTEQKVLKDAPPPAKASDTPPPGAPAAPPRRDSRGHAPS